MKRTMSKLLSILLVMCVVLQYVPAVFAAEEVREMTEGYTEVAAPDTDLPENNELFAMYVEQALYDTRWTAFGTAAREHLNAVEQAIYDALKAEIEAVAAAGGSTKFVMSEVSGLQTRWTSAELEVDSLTGDNVQAAVKAAMNAQFTLGNVVSALLSDCPFDLYWYDKTLNGGAAMSYGISYNAAQAVISNLTFTFRVAADYQGGDNTTVTSEVGRVDIAKANARIIVEKYASKTAYEKLEAYKTEICDLVDYNYDALNNAAVTSYGDPYQLIYVFDGDETTKVVCEGYSKAFQYLCDLSGLDCISVSGEMRSSDNQGGPHMWNIVPMNGANYLVDVTSCENDFDMFMAGTPNGSVEEGYTFSFYYGQFSLFYGYDEDIIEFWAEEDLTLASANYDPNTAPGCSHNYESVMTAPTCTAGGYTVYTCTLCGDSYTGDETEALGHTEETVPGYAATCTEAGLSDGVACAVCGETLTAQEEIPALGHTEETVPGYVATCTEAGLSDGVACAVCGEILAAQEEIPATGHSYENGTCTGCGSGVVLNAATGATYATLTDAVAAAEAGQTLQLLDNWTEDRVMVTGGITLDLNGSALTCEYLVCFDEANVIDSVGTGRLVTPRQNVVLDEGNGMIPVYDGEAYIFTKAGFALRRDENYTGAGIKINVTANPVRMDVVELLKDGSADNNIEIMLLLSWDTADGTGSQKFVFTDEVVAQVYSSNMGSWNSYSQMFTMVITGFETISNLRAEAAIVSGTDAEYVSSNGITIGGMQ